MKKMRVKLNLKPYLHKGIFAKQRAGESGCCSQESRICNFLHSLSNRENQSSIHKRDNDVGIEFI